MASIAQQAPAHEQRIHWSRKLVLHAVLWIACALIVFPFLWMFSTMFKPANEIFTKEIQLFPRSFTLDNFPNALKVFPVGRWAWNSFGIATLTTLGKLLISVPAAFVFAKLQFRGKRLLFTLVLATMIVPGVVTVVPNYVMINEFGWLNSWWGVIVPSLPGTAFYVFLLRQNMMTLPQELLEAGRVDGAGTYRTLWDIVIPNMKPAIAVVTILSFLGAWNQYMWPLLVLGGFENRTLATGMPFFTSNAENAQMWGPMMATAGMAALPPLIIYAIFQKQIIDTFVTSGIKG